MTAEIINLNRVRKAKARAAKDEVATVNRAAFGRPKAEREQLTAESARKERVLDGARIAADQAANEGGFPASAEHVDEDLDPGNVS